MFSKIGTGELVVILLVALIIFGPSKLPALGKMAGKAIGTLRGYVDGNGWDELLEEEEEEKKSSSNVKKAAAAPAAKAEPEPAPAAETESEPETAQPAAESEPEEKTAD